MQPGSRWFSLSAQALALFSVAYLLSGPSLVFAQGWTGLIEVAVVGQDESTTSSNGGFRSQHNLDEGFLLRALDLQWTNAESDRKAEIRAWGFGDAEPSEGAEARWRFAKPWELEVEYRRSESFFQLAESDLGLRQDDWEITRFKIGVTYDGWKAARLGLRLGVVERDGTLTQPFRELNTLYLLGIDLDESRQEAAFRLETRTLPVKLTFEQSFAQLERRNRRFVANPAALGGSTSNLFADAASTRREDREIPISRLAAAWANDRVAITGAVLHSPGDLDVSGETSATFAIDGGRVGSFELATDILGAASFDALAGHLAIDIRLAERWTLQLQGDHHDRAQDATLVGARILRATSPLGDRVEIPEILDDATAFDVTDTGWRAALEYDSGKWSAWGGVLGSEREVSYAVAGEDLVLDPSAFEITRESDGFVLGVGVDLGRRLDLSTEFERGDFEEFVFRNDPETVDRLRLRLRAKLSESWQLRIRGRFEESDNPLPTTLLDRSSEGFGAGLFWVAKSGKQDFGVDFEALDLSSETGLVFPDGSPGLSLYDLSLETWTIHGRAEVGSRIKLSGHGHWVEDGGSTWPFEAWNARLRLGVVAVERVEVALFGEYWSYDEELAQGDDFDVSRYGLGLVWRFE